ncbi:MAG TPA: DMT family transporter [Thermodesulfobacteriota bacterium]
MNPDTRGALYLTVAVASLTVASAIIKHLAADLPVAVVVFFRHLAATLCFLPMVARSGFGLLRTENLPGHVWRATLGYTSFMAFAYALERLLLADAIALSYTAPLWSTLLAAVILREAVSRGRILALVAGLLGVVLIARPAGQFEPASLVAVAGAACTSLAMLAVKQLSRTEPPERIAFYFMAIGSVLSAVPAAFAWRTPAVSAVPWFVAIGVLSWLGQICLSRGYAIGQFSRMALVDLLRLPFSLLLGLAVFGEVPDLLAAAGMALIGAASVYTVIEGRRRSG